MKILGVLVFFGGAIIAPILSYELGLDTAASFLVGIVCGSIGAVGGVILFYD